MAGARYLLSLEYLLVVTAALGDHPAYKWLRDHPYFVCPADGAAAMASVIASKTLSAEERSIHRDNLLRLLRTIEREGRLVAPDPQAILKWGELSGDDGANSVDPMDAQFLALAINGEFTVVGPYREIYAALQIAWFDPAVHDPPG